MNAPIARTYSTDYNRRQALHADRLLPLIRAQMIANLDVAIAERALAGCTDAHSKSYPSGASPQLRVCADVLGHYQDLGFKVERVTSENRWFIKIAWGAAEIGSPASDSDRHPPAL